MTRSGTNAADAFPADDPHERVAAVIGPHRLHLPSSQEPVIGESSLASVRAMDLLRVRYGNKVAVETQPAEQGLIVWGPRAPMTVEWCRSGRTAVVDSPVVASAEEPMRWLPPQAGCVVVATSLTRLTAYLARHAGPRHGGTLQFVSTSAPDTAAVPGALVEHACEHACRVLDAAGGGPVHPMATDALEESLLTALLLGLPHTASEVLARPLRARVRHHLATRIREWVRAHHHEPVSVTDMAAASGVGTQQLREICRAEWGVTPVHYLRGVRLDHAREHLLTAPQCPGTIATAAADVGYRHMGRFAIHYRERFGESPGQTLNRPRNDQ